MMTDDGTILDLSAHQNDFFGDTLSIEKAIVYLTNPRLTATLRL